jgi:hypothetical protein
MSLITLPTTPVVVAPPSLTLVQLQFQEGLAIRQKAVNLYGVLVPFYNNLMATVWANPRGLTAQQVCDSLGTDAGTLFQAAAIAAQLILLGNSSAPLTTVPTGATITINADGTVTIGGV